MLFNVDYSLIIEVIHWELNTENQMKLKNQTKVQFVNKSFKLVCEPVQLILV